MFTAIRSAVQSSGLAEQVDPIVPKPSDDRGVTEGGDARPIGNDAAALERASDQQCDCGCLV